MEMSKSIRCFGSLAASWLFEECSGCCTKMRSLRSFTPATDQLNVWWMLVFERDILDSGHRCWTLSPSFRTVFLLLLRNDDHDKTSHFHTKIIKRYCTLSRRCCFDTCRFTSLFNAAGQQVSALRNHVTRCFTWSFDLEDCNTVSIQFVSSKKYLKSLRKRQLLETFEWILPPKWNFLLKVLNRTKSVHTKIKFEWFFTHEAPVLMLMRPTTNAQEKSTKQTQLCWITLFTLANGMLRRSSPKLAGWRFFDSWDDFLAFCGFSPVDCVLAESGWSSSAIVRRGRIQVKFQSRKLVSKKGFFGNLATFRSSCRSSVTLYLLVVDNATVLTEILRRIWIASPSASLLSASGCSKWYSMSTKSTYDYFPSIKSFSKFSSDLEEELFGFSLVDLARRKSFGSFDGSHTVDQSSQKYEDFGDYRLQ